MSGTLFTSEWPSKVDCEIEADELKLFNNLKVLVQ